MVCGRYVQAQIEINQSNFSLLTSNPPNPIVSSFFYFVIARGKTAMALPTQQPVAAIAGRNTTASEVKISISTIEKAISALLKYRAAQTASEKPQLFPQDDYIYLNLTLKKIPSNSRTNPFKISLPHPLLDPSSQLCLIIDDRPQSPTPPSEKIKKLIKSQNIPISKVLKISKLKANYKPFEAKRKLCDSYDLFLVDKRVVHLLPKLIGKEFFKKKKLPLGVDLSKKNLKSQVEKALGSALLYLRTGTCCVMKVGKVAMDTEEVVDNVLNAIAGAVNRVPKQWNGVRSLHLKFHDSVALPIYQAMPDVKLKIEGVKKEKVAELVKLSDNEAEVKEISGRKDGNSGKKKGRIHEVRYMDVGDVVESADEDEHMKSEDNDEFVGQKNKKGNMLGESDDNGTEDETDVIKDKDSTLHKPMGKKRNKGKTMKEGVLGELNVDKRAKKKAKAEKVEGGKSKKDILAGGDKSGAKKGKKKSEVDRRLSERISKGNVTKKKGVSAK